MIWKQRYFTAKQKLLTDLKICAENRQVFEEFLKYEEYKLKRINRMPALDEKSYKTVYWYLTRLRTVNRWFDNKPWKNLTREDIKRVYDDVEDGKILTRYGKSVRGKDTYYRRILRGKPFALVGKDHLAREVMEFYIPEAKEDPRFIPESDFRKMVRMVTKPEHVAFLWLAWDIGENVGALLQLRKNDLRRQIDPESNQAEYAVNLDRAVLKRARMARMEITNYSETTEAIDAILINRESDDLLFDFGGRMAAKIVERASQKSGVRCSPRGEKVRLKDLRSSMACDLLSKGCSTDEANRRLGHRPGSREIQKYANWLALDTRKAKLRLQQTKHVSLESEVSELRDRLIHASNRQRELQQTIDEMRMRIDTNNRFMFDQFRELVRKSGLGHIGQDSSEVKDRAKTPLADEEFACHFQQRYATSIPPSI